jgi:hypothetical protein
MAIKVQSIEELQQYFRGVVERAECHAPGVADIIYPLLGMVVLKLDDKSDIQVRSYNDAPGNILWAFINGTRYTFRYEHSDQSIEIRKDSYRGPVLHKITNHTSISALKAIFNTL